VNLEEYFLHYVLGIRGGAQHPEDEPPDVTPMSAKELGERRPIAALGATDQLIDFHGLGHGYEPIDPPRVRGAGPISTG
jgi:hypothetical protein